MEILNSDPRVRADVEIIYPALERNYADRELNYLIILPFYQDYSQVVSRNNQLINNNSLSKWIFNAAWLEIIEKGYGLRRFITIEDLMSFFYVNWERTLLDAEVDPYIYLNMAIRPFSVNMTDDTASSVFTDEIPTMRFLYHALSTGGAEAVVLFYNYYNPSESLSSIFLEYKDRTTLFEDIELFIDGGLSSGQFSNNTIRNEITILYNNIKNYKDDIMYVFDSDVRLVGTKAYDAFLNRFYAFQTPTFSDYNKILLSGWFRLYNHIMPPSYAYLLVLIRQYTIGNRFDSIVNKVNLLLRRAESIYHKKPREIRDDVFDNDNLVSGQRSTANILCKPNANSLVFLTDYTLLREANVLRYDYAARAALYGKKKVTSIASKYIGLRINEITPKVLEQLINQELEDEPDLNSFVVVPEFTEANKITIFYNIVVGLAVYTIDITLTATA